MPKQLVVHHLNRFGAKSNLTVPDATRHLFLQFLKRAADYEQNVPGVDRLTFGLATPLKLERRLQLRLQIVHAADRHFCFLH